MMKKITIGSVICGLLLFGTFLVSGCDKGTRHQKARHAKQVKADNKRIVEDMKTGYYTFKDHTYITFRTHRSMETMTVVHDPDCPKCVKEK